MHPSAYRAMAGCINRHLPADGSFDVLEFGSHTGLGRPTFRKLLGERRVRYVGVDIRAGNNVDVVMTKPYTLPIKRNSVDVVLTGQVFEHVPFFWASFMEIARVLRPGGLVLMTVPSRGHKHTRYDCWRYYPDGMRAIAAHTGLELVEAGTDFPPMVDGRHDYASIEPGRYWGDTIGVFRKPARVGAVAAARTAVVRAVARWWANSVGDLEAHPIPRRRRQARRASPQVAGGEGAPVSFPGSPFEPAARRD